MGAASELGWPPARANPGGQLVGIEIVQRSRGRPSRAAADGLSELIIKTALTSFRQVGYEATSIDAVASACKASKHTIYRRFPGKEALFTAAVAQDRREVLARFEAIETDLEHTMEALRATCHQLFEIAVSPGSTDLYRACIGAVPRFPLIGLQLAETENQIQDVLEPLVARAQAEGHLEPGDPRQMSGQLYYCTIGEAWGHALLGLAYINDEAARAKLFDSNWRMFIRGHTPGPSKGV